MINRYDINSKTEGEQLKKNRKHKKLLEKNKNC